MDKLLGAILKIRFLVLILLCGVMVWGLNSYLSITRDAFPDISPVMVPVFCEADGLAAEEVEQMISQPVETAMSGLPDVTLVKSTSGFGLGVVYVYFKDHVNIYFARQLVAERLESVAALLPPGVPKPELGPISTGLGQIFIYYLQADKNEVDTQGKAVDAWLRELNDFVVKRQLQTVPGVTGILSMGGHVLQYQVRLDPDAMRRHDVAFSDVVEKIQRRWVIQGNVSGRAPSEIVADMRKAIAEKVDLPAGYFVEFGGQFENQERAMKKLCIIVPIVIGIILLLLWMTFNSFRSSLIVMINVPLALIGGVIGLWATDGSCIDGRFDAYELLSFGFGRN